jgi:hypothetical protein
MSNTSIYIGLNRGQREDGYNVVCSVFTQVVCQPQGKSSQYENYFPISSHVYNLIGYRGHKYPQMYKIHLNTMHNGT